MGRAATRSFCNGTGTNSAPISVALKNFRSIVPFCLLRVHRLRYGVQEEQERMRHAVAKDSDALGFPQTWRMLRIPNFIRRISYPSFRIDRPDEHQNSLLHPRDCPDLATSPKNSTFRTHARTESPTFTQAAPFSLRLAPSRGNWEYSHCCLNIEQWHLQSHICKIYQFLKT